MEEKVENGKLQAILAQLTKDQLRLVVALQEYPSKDAAAKAIGVKAQTVYNWPADLIDEAARLMALDAVNSALELRRRNLIKAVGVKAAGLDSKNEVVRQKAASEIIEWELGKANQPLSGKDGEPLIPKDADETRSEILRKLDSIAAAAGAAGVSKPVDGN